MSIAVEDWDDLRLRAAPRRAGYGRRGIAPGRRARSRGPVRAIVAPEAFHDDSLDGEPENLRPLLAVAGGNIATWVLAHLTGIVELIGVSFFASGGLLLGAYILREWHRDRSAHVCLIGGLPPPPTIFGLLT